MSPDDIKKLLGGYATGTLTEAEQQALFAAALEDQDLFDALAHEQTLRDLLGDPAARAELISALDTPASRSSFSFWQWLRRPVVAGLATAGVATIAVVMVWQGTRIAAVKPAPTIVAELRDQPAPVQPPAEIPPPASERESGRGSKVLKVPPPARLAAEEAPPAAPAPSPSGMPVLVLRKDKSAEALAVKAPTPPPSVPAATPALMARKAKTEAESATSGQTAGALGAVQESVVADARALFYTNQAAPAANAFVQPRAAGGAALPVRPASPQVDTGRDAKVVAGLMAPPAATAPRLGVRVSILRGDREVDLTTALDPGETVRLKLTPNADGFLYVVEGARLVVSGPAQRLKAFETPELHFAGSGRKQLYVILSRGPRTVDPSTVGSLARDLVETTAAQDRATYVVSGERDAGAQQVVVPVTLTWR